MNDDSSVQPQPTTDDTPTEDGLDGQACEDKVSPWKCKSLKTVYACKASAYFKHLSENCAKTRDLY